MVITKQDVADKLIAYLKHKITITQLVDWAENAMMEGEFDTAHSWQIALIISRLGLADVKAFGLVWEDCEEYLKKLGYDVKIHIEASS